MQILGWQDGSGGKGDCLQARIPEFDPQNSHGERRELTSLNCPLTSTGMK